MDTLLLEFGGTGVLRDDSMIGDYTFVFTLTDVKGGTATIRQDVKIKEPTAPVFESDVSASLDIMQRTPFTYSFPLITEGDLAPATAPVVVTTGLDASLVATQATNESGQIVITVAYAGGDEIKAYAGQAGLTVTVTLTDS